MSEMITAVTALECDSTARLIRCAVACASQSLETYLAGFHQHAVRGVIKLGEVLPDDEASWRGEEEPGGEGGGGGGAGV